MGKVTGFLEIARREGGALPMVERVGNFAEFTVGLSDAELAAQGARCMDCGIPYCHADCGCPLNNLIPDWNDLVYRGDWRAALDALHATNNFPEFTGRVCPAPCESACTLYLTDEPVTIKTIEQAIAERGWREGWVVPQPASAALRKRGKRVAVVGSGAAGLACAQELARGGHRVVVFEKQARSGGLLRYGIPDFKLDKGVVDRRLGQLEAEGVEFRCGVRVGGDGDDGVAVQDLLGEFAAVVLAGGAEQARDLAVEGRELGGVHLAMDYLRSNSRRVQGEERGALPEVMDARGKRVVVIGGGDTGSDCIGTAHRQGAERVTQVEILGEPPAAEEKGLSWPNWPNKLRTSSSQEEGCERLWGVATEGFVDDGRGRVGGVRCRRVVWREGRMEGVAGSEFVLEAGLVTLAMGFLHPERRGLLEELVGEGLRLDGRGNVAAGETATGGRRAYETSLAKVFAAGDMRRGQSLVVWAIREGRGCARAVEAFLRGEDML